MLHGTSYFLSVYSACAYYRSYGYTQREVQKKIAAGEIHIGVPPVGEGEVVTLIDGGMRYAILTRS
jgi:hypothetical protein